MLLIISNLYLIISHLKDLPKLLDIVILYPLY